MSSRTNSTARSSNFFLQPLINSTSVDFTTAALIHPILQDVHTLRKLADAQNIDRFLNDPIDVTNDKNLSMMSNLALDISQALHSIVLPPACKSTSTRKISQLSSKLQRGQKAAILATRPVPNKQSRVTKRCRLCGVTETPRWRDRSSSWSLCNVCGLMDSRRSIRNYPIYNVVIFIIAFAKTPKKFTASIHNKAMQCYT
ncbi:hypothetical protein FGSG_04626 [Fusarium graminearum PH-1]|uniref:hypothetical protein n=1 Tax=Gibberella zeae (strain ATCC MYA-4620 / CBS 123657 / FGSC 9075 / NRRL 31084 / PH-1) TaxID=229533 RepID=UPI000023CBA9|nr:hypothetical protein FGSG_04626 [Fusarium graminearum PH-1]ESU08448.1 hypothetical protein FGSG_04626 [Fusarium graminearum PH-1]EYB27938.1 hypothetical protein FG05_04626 [Fusarium graminearum]|eukprot:XP_011320947.1 hypothetical protein FGSG_04626 [Fusarium graminearum PH-1]